MIRIFKYLKLRDWLMLVFALGLIVFEVWLELTMPDYTSRLTTSATSSDSIDLGDVWANGGMMMLCASGSCLAAIATGILASLVSADLSRTLRERLFDKITSFSDAEINRFSTASLITRTTNDVVQVQMLIGMGAQIALKAPILAVWALTKISATSVEWTSAALITVASIVVVILVVILFAFPRFRRIQKLTDALNQATRDNIAGVRVIRAFNAEAYQTAKFERVNDDVTRNNLFTDRLFGLLMPTLSLAMNGLVLAIYWIGAYLINRQMTIPGRAEVLGNMVGFTQYALQIVMSFLMLVAIFIFLPRSMVSCRRINEVLDTKPSIVFPDKPVETNRTGEVEFQHVRFAYNDGEEDVLQDLSFKIEGGSTFAIIGATGTGKTSLVNLIPRFYDVKEGSVLLNGVDIREYPLEQIQEKISFAPQKAILFKETVANNIAYGREADNERIQRCLRIAHADFVDELQGGTSFEVAQGGSNLSGGQKQRLSIARALYKNAEIVIFDDTFSALDYKTDSLVRQSLREELAGTTVIIVAQRIGTIKNADRILVLDEGRIVGLGTHEELLQNCPVYKEIALSQLKEEEL